jgi:hypothetical protein
VINNFYLYWACSISSDELRHVLTDQTIKAGDAENGCPLFSMSSKALENALIDLRDKLRFARRPAIVCQERGALCREERSCLAALRRWRTNY